METYSRLAGINNNIFSITTSDNALDVAYSNESGDCFVCGARATFGSFKFSENIPLDEAMSLLDSLMKYIYKEFSSFEIRLPPEYLNPVAYEVFDFYFSDNPGAIINETNQFIALQHFEGSKSLSKTHRRIFNGLIRKGVRSTVSETISYDGYNLLSRNRAQRGVSLSLSYEELVEQSVALRGRYLFFSCLSADELLMAYSVCVKISKDVLYVLYWGEDPAFRGYSPVVYLSQEICRFAAAHHYKFVDVGISSVAGVLDENLYAFKKRLGYSDCRKYIIGGRCA